MPTAFTALSWNVEHFQVEDDDPKRPARVQRVAELLEQEDPDIFALYEVQGKDLFEPLMDLMPHHHFHITEGGELQEILVGVRSDVQSFVTQRNEFKEGNEALRPGSVLTVRVDDVNTTLLFLHTKSGTKEGDLALRQEMFQHAFSLKTALNRRAKGKARYMFMGDFNLMGAKTPKGKVTAAQEIAWIEAQAKKAGMTHLAKDRPYSWWNGPKHPGIPKSDLDHVVATPNIKFRTWGPAQVQVRGWPTMTNGADQQAWIDEYSDHGYMWMEVLKG